MMESGRVFRLSVCAQDVSRFVAACEAAGWHACDTGERIMTDDGPDAEAVLLVEAVASIRSRAALAAAL